ncbi:type I polyketide synthase [Lentzea jiangxiensis]|uniref:Polyketide synthase 12 n=1 Tax=Lentzea jiangxiensis TaxID=641025 RepID=A0A1H0X5N2_9PSEU|nr:type I polyketide synthase [Lentzea jiangxiensis]SDP98230.1 polyketide synthase 12 [Lentzea jiangxiensis]
MTAEPIAVVGVGCRLPGGVSSASELLDTLRDGRDCVTEIPSDRWDVDAFHAPDTVRPAKMIARHGGFLSGIDEFDAGFFGISGAEAARLDPQQKIVLQTVWQAFEHAGQNPEELKGTNTAVFVGASNTNSHVSLKLHAESFAGITGYEATSDAISVIAGRVASFFGLQGPCMTVDTACSGSLVALHLARQSLLSGECDTAVVVGINVLVYPAVHIAFSKAGLLSPTGRCRAFDADADGYVRSEGCIAVVLRRESVAVDRGDRIIASVLGTAVNHHGRSVGITAPDRQAQERVMRTALAQAGVRPGQVGYLDAHGTGTPVGDPMEMSSIVDVYGAPRPEQLRIGSAKSNFGHLEAGAGLLGLVKAALSLEHETIFPSVHFTRWNPKIDLRDADITVPTEPIAWPRTIEPRIAGVNSFGYSGTNACVILREAPATTTAPADKRGHELLVLSAKSEESLNELAERWAEFLTGSPDGLGAAAFTAATGRAPLRHRVAVVGSDAASAAESLRRWRCRRPGASVAHGRARKNTKVAFVFTGQGSQYEGMGRELYDREPVFAAEIDRCAEVMDPELGRPLREVLFDENDWAEDTTFAQPALFAVEYALAELLRSWGVVPSVVIGHSVGEIAAACISGLLDFAGAAKFAAVRGRLMGALPSGGRMLAVATTEDVARNWLLGKEDIAIAGVNGPRSVVVSGAAEAVGEIERLAAEKKVRTTVLHVSHAFHSSLMDPVLAELEEFAATLTTSEPAIPMVSTLTGQQLTGDEGPAYWSRQAREAVRFHDGMRVVAGLGCPVIVEVGPHPALIPAVSAVAETGTRLVATLRRDRQDAANLLRAAGELFVTGAGMEPARLFATAPRERLAAPLYPFRRDRYWFSPDGPGAIPQEPQRVPRGVSPEPVQPEAVQPGEVTTTESTLTATTPWVDHRILGKTVFPASGYLELAVRAARPDDRAVVLSDVDFRQPLVLLPRKKTTISVELDDAGRFVIGRNDDGAVFCRGKVTAEEPAACRLPPGELRDQLTAGLAPGRFYGKLREVGMEYGATFSTVRELWNGAEGSGTALGRITTAPDGAPHEEHEHRLSTLVDGALHVVAAALSTLSSRALDGAYVPAKLGRVAVTGPLPVQVWSRVSVRVNDAGSVAVATVDVTDDDGNVLVRLDEAEFRHTSALADDGVAIPGTTRRAGDARAELMSKMDGLTRDKQLAVVTEWVVEEVKDTLGRLAAEYEYELDVSSLDPSSALLEIGLDSLMITEFQRRIQEKLDFRFKAMEAVEYQSMTNLAEYVLDNVLVLAPAA